MFICKATHGSLCFHLIPQSLRPEVSRLQTAVDKAVSNREQYVGKFCHHLDKDIVALGQEVTLIKNDSQVCTLEMLFPHICVLFVCYL